MRAASRPHPSETTVAPLPAGAARSALLRLAAALLATAALLLVSGPAVVQAQVAGGRAQDSSARGTPAPAARATHVVRGGETLWSIATRYFGDGASWAELARRNGIAVTSTRPLVIGMRLTVPATPPARAAGAAAAATKAASEVPKVATIPAAARPVAQESGTTAPRRRGALAAQTAGKGDAAAVSPRASRAAAPKRVASAGDSSRAAPARPAPTRSMARPSGVAVRSDTAGADSSGATRLQPLIKSETPIDRGATRIGLVDPGAASAARGKEVETIFLLRVPTMADAEAAVGAAMPARTVVPRYGEYVAAPFAIAADRLARGGRMVRRVGAAAAGATREVQRALIADDVEITAPAGVTLAVGDRLVTVMDEGPLTRGTSRLRVAVPGGVLEVTQAEAGKPIIATVRSQSGIIEQGQRLLPLDGQPVVVERVEPVQPADVRTSVLWVDNRSLLPTLQSYLLLDAGTAEGVRAGDEFMLVRPRGSTNTGEEDRIAVVRVVRSGPEGSTGIVVKQDRGDIATGVVARRIARAP